jgi:DNA repair protein RecN (Recombination protein N)
MRTSSSCGRVNARDGRKTAFINDRRASGEVLRALSETLVELHGQQDDRGLLNPRGHRQLLDAFGALAPLVEATRAEWRRLGAARGALAAAEGRVAALAAEETYLRHAVAELDALNPEPGEDAALDARRRLMQGAARIRDDVARALAALGEDGAEGRMTDAVRWLEGAAERADGALDEAIDALGRALTELGEASQGVERALDALGFDPGELEAAEERLFAIRALARKHGVLPDDLGTLAGELRAKLSALDGGAANLKALKAEVAAAEAAYGAAADALGRARAEAARRLDAGMADELAPLRMERAVFATEIAGGEPGPRGATRCSSRWPPTRARRPDPWAASPRAGNCRGSCWR